MKRANLAHVSKEIQAQSCGPDVVVMRRGRHSIDQMMKYAKSAEIVSRHLSDLRDFINEIEFAKKRLEFAHSESVQDSVLRDWLSTVDSACNKML